MGPNQNGIFALALLALSLVNIAVCQVPTGFLPYNFTLAAVNVTLPNANLTGAPLVLGQDGTRFPSALVPQLMRYRCKLRHFVLRHIGPLISNYYL
jgi:hypothetical protein